VYDYSRLKKTATNLIAKYGRPVTLRQLVKSNNSFDPDLIPVDTVVTAVQLSFKASEIDGKLVKTGDKKFVFVTDVAVETGMQIIDGSETYRLIPVEEKKPGDTSLVWFVAGRK
jgi:hypothetical protein